MRKLFIAIASLLYISMAQGQNVGIGTTTPNASAQLDISSTTKGLLIPRMTDLERNAILSPAKGLMVFVITDSSFYYHDGANWKRVQPVNETWSLNGNANTTGKFIGTVDNAPVRIFTNNTEKLTVAPNGYVGINNPNPQTGLHMVDNGSINTDIQMEYNTDQAAAGGLLFTKSKGTPALKTAVDSGNYLGGMYFYGYGTTGYHVGIGLEAYTEGDFTTPAGRKAGLAFYTRDGNTYAKRMYISGIGNIGIGTTAPNASAQLDVSSTTKGLLPPRMTQAQRNAIPSPVAGLMLLCSNCGINGEMQMYNGTAWTNMIGGPAAAVVTPLAIGQNYLGGIIAYILQPGDPDYNANVQHGLIAAATDQISSTFQYFNSWGCNGTAIPGANGTALGTGNQNTIAIMAGCGTEAIAARICGDLVLNGFSDWYLPSKDELNKLYINRVAIGGFSSTSYWSSSEIDGSSAWFQFLHTGGQLFDNKLRSDRVRAVRAF